MQNFDHNIVFWEQRQIFRRKLAKIAENCDHNIDPRLCKISPSGEYIFELGLHFGAILWSSEIETKLANKIFFYAGLHIGGLQNI
jgi:hypothetical protein